VTIHPREYVCHPTAKSKIHMKALITSAGLGSRIPELKNTNKSLIKIGNKTLISRAIDSLNSHGIRDIYVITGHNAEKVENEIAGRATPIFNPLYKTSGIIVSMWFAKQFLEKEDFIFMTNDVLFDPKLINKCLISKKGNDIVIPMERKESYDKEDSKIIVQGDKIIKTGKNLPLHKTSGEFGHMALFSKKGSGQLFDKIESFILEKKINSYLMDVFNALIEDGVHLYPVDITGIPRIEIDYMMDLISARKKIFPLIK